MTDILDIVEGEEYFNPEDLDEREVLGDDDEDSSKQPLVKKEEVDGDDLYDAAIEPSGISEKRESSENVVPQVKVETSQPTNYVSHNINSSSAQHQTGKRYCCYVGNMTWWTTDNDLQAAILNCGVKANELVDLKFHENRNNGQSKGFALVVFSTESAVRTVTEKLTHKKLHEQNLVVLPYNKQSLSKLEDATKRIEQKEKKDDKAGMINMGTVRIGPAGGVPSLNIAMPLSGLSLPRPNILPPSTQPPSSLMNLNFSNPLQPATGIVSSVTNLSQGFQQQARTGTPNIPSYIPSQQQPLQQQSQPQQPRPLSHLLGPPPTNVPPPSVMSRPPPNFPGQQQPSMLNTSAPPPLQGMQNNQLGGIRTSVPPPGMPPHGMPPSSQATAFPPGAHINPQVYPSFAPNFPGGNMMNSGSGLGGHPENGNSGGVVSEAEFEEIMNRNRTVSSSAINRAVSDATNGDFASAIETLVTAISLIRQSRVSNDDRCKVLIASLQDTLQGIESKSYNSSSSRKHRSGRGDRSRSPSERSSRKRHRRASHSRSRSRDRYDYSPRHSTRRY